MRYGRSLNPFSSLYLLKLTLAAYKAISIHVVYPLLSIHPKHKNNNKKHGELIGAGSSVGRLAILGHGKQSSESARLYRLDFACLYSCNDSRSPLLPFFSLATSSRLSIVFQWRTESVKPEPCNRPLANKSRGRNMWQCTPCTHAHQFLYHMHARHLPSRMV
jgi:hypothetical protein